MDVPAGLSRRTRRLLRRAVAEPALFPRLASLTWVNSSKGGCFVVSRHRPGAGAGLHRALSWLFRLVQNLPRHRAASALIELFVANSG